MTMKFATGLRKIKKKKNNMLTFTVEKNNPLLSSLEFPSFILINISKCGG